MADPSSNSSSRQLEVETQTGGSGIGPLREPLVPGLTVLYHPDLARVGDRTVLTQLTGGREQGLSRLEPLFAPPGGSTALPLSSPFLSRRPLRIWNGVSGGLVLNSEALPRSVQVDDRPLHGERVITAAELADGVVLLLAHRVVLLLSWLDPSGIAGGPDLGIVGASPAIERLRREILRLADLDVPVLVEGETGAGKELVARALHAASGRRGALVPVNLGAIPPSLAVAELFGALPGAFTGAHRGQPGYFRRAHGGTLFLDEIGEAPGELQPILLRALETREIQPLGSARPERVDVRVVCATDRSLEAEVEAGRLRAALLFRLAAARIAVPPLRARREDFGRLLVHFLRREAELCGESHRLTGGRAEDTPWLPAEAVARLARGAWPGNVRELANVVRQLVISGRGQEAIPLPKDFEHRLECPAAGLHSAGLHSAGLRSTGSRRPRDVDERELLATLEAHGGRINQAAEALGIGRSSLYNLIKKSATARTAADLGSAEIRACYHRQDGDLDRMATDLRVSRRALVRRMSQLGLDPQSLPPGLPLT